MILKIFKDKKNVLLRFYNKNKLILEKNIDNLQDIRNIDTINNNSVKQVFLDYSFCVNFKKEYPILNRRRLLKEQSECFDKIYDGKFLSIKNQFKYEKNNVIVYSALIDKTIFEFLKELFRCSILLMNHKFKDRKFHIFIDDYNIVFKDNNLTLFYIDNFGYDSIIYYLYYINYEGLLNVFINKNSSINIEDVKKQLNNNIENKVSLHIEYY